MRLYELTYLLPGDFSDTEIIAVREKILAVLQEENAVVKNEANPVKKKLGAKIKKNNFAFLIALVFEMNPEQMASLEKKLKRENQILRYMIAVKKIFAELKLRPKKMSKEFRPKIPSDIIKKEGVEKGEISAKKSSRKVGIKEIDKKLEEILGE